MRYLTLLAFLLTTPLLHAQDSTATTPITTAAVAVQPSYCSEASATMGDPNMPGGATSPPLPKFATTPTKEYKVQVAILRYTDPSEYPFHPTLVARYRPCEQVWVIESRQSFTERADAVALQDELAKAGYAGSYITDLVAYY